jgi:hypothetical protein
MSKYLLCLLSVFATLSLSAENTDGGKKSSDNTDKITVDDKASQIELQSRVESINEELNEKKALKKELKEVNEDASFLLNYTKAEVNTAELGKLITELEKDKRTNTFVEIARTCFSNYYTFQGKLEQLGNETKNNELRALTEKLLQRIRFYMASDYFESMYDATFTARIDMNKVKQTFSKENVDKLNKEMIEMINAFKGELTAEIGKLDTDIKSLNGEKLVLMEQLEKKSDANETIFKWGFPTFIFFILALYLIPLSFFHRRKPKMKEEEQGGDLVLYSAIYSTGLITEIITVFLLTSTILLLGLTDKMSSEILGTLIGGISGYVLGKTLKAKNGNDGG